MEGYGGGGGGGIYTCMYMCKLVGVYIHIHV